MSIARRLASALLPPRLAEYLRRRLRDRAVARFGAYDATHSYGGRPLRVHIADPLAQGWYDHDWDAPSEVGFMQRQGRLRPGARVFDAGAHQGVVAMMLADVVGREGTVVAIEAVVHNARIARRNAEANDLGQLQVVHAALADADGALWFEDRWNGAVSKREGVGVRVEAVTVDTLAARFGAPDVLYVDVEGFELHALRGAARTLAAARPDLCIEAHVGAGLERFGTVDDLLALIPAGYRIFIAPGEAGDFVPLDDGRALLQERCRIVAFAGDNGEIPSHG